MTKMQRKIQDKVIKVRALVAQGTAVTMACKEVGMNSATFKKYSQQTITKQVKVKKRRVKKPVLLEAKEEVVTKPLIALIGQPTDVMASIEKLFQ